MQQDILQKLSYSSTWSCEPNKALYDDAVARLQRMYERIDCDDDVFTQLAQLLIEAHEGLDKKIRACLSGKEIDLSHNETRWITSTMQLHGGDSCLNLVLDIHSAVVLHDAEQLFSRWVSLRRKLCPVVLLLKHIPAISSPQCS